MATEGERQSLRRLLGESIPLNGTEADTNFTDEQLDELLSNRDGSLDAAAHDGWEQKAALFANLVNTAESGNRRDLSDLHESALKMMHHFGVKASLTQYRSRTRVHPLTRT